MCLLRSFQPYQKIKPTKKRKRYSFLLKNGIIQKKESLLISIYYKKDIELDWVSTAVYDLCHRYVSSTLHCEVDESTHYTDITKYYKKAMTIFRMPCLPTAWLTCNVVQNRKRHSQWKSNVQSLRVCTSLFILIYFTFSFTGFFSRILSHNAP